jgi:hypothetical protein
MLQDSFGNSRINGFIKLTQYGGPFLNQIQCSQSARHQKHSSKLKFAKRHTGCSTITPFFLSGFQIANTSERRPI